MNKNDQLRNIGGIGISVVKKEKTQNGRDKACFEETKSLFYLSTMRKTRIQIYIHKKIRKKDLIWTTVGKKKKKKRDCQYRIP